MAKVSEQFKRWSKAIVYPDMWVNPDVNPRNTDRISANGELVTLQDYLSDYRLTLRMKCEELHAEQLACRSVPPSSRSLLGLLRHLAEMERDRRIGKDGIAVRELLVHRIEEYARHAGHTDLLRECIDGRVGH